MTRSWLKRRTSYLAGSSPLGGPLREVRRNPVTCAGETAKALASNPRRAAPPALQSIEKP